MTTRRTYGQRAAARDDEDLESGIEFVMSDGSVDRIGDIIEPEGWQLAAFKKNPIALYAHDNHGLPIGTWERVHVENKQLRGVLKLAEKGIHPFIDAIRDLLATGVLKACSVGFIPVEEEPLDPEKPWRGYRYLKSKLLECSVVAVPANQNALAVRGMEDPAIATSLRAKFGNTAELQRELSGLITKSGVAPKPEGKHAMSLADRIKAAQDELIALKDTQAPLLKKVNEGDEELTAEEQAEFDRIEEESVGVMKRLNTMRATERNLAGAAAGGARGNLNTPAIIQTNPLAAAGQARGIGNHKPSPKDLLIRMTVVHLRAAILRKPVDEIQREVYPDLPEMEAVCKAATNPANTTTAGWAAELVNTAIADFIDNLKAISAYAALSGYGNRFSFDRNGVIKIPRRNPGTGTAGDLRGAFVGEGAPIPVRRGSFGSISLTPHKMGVISTFTREIALRSTPAIEGLIREGIMDDTAVAIDTALLDAVAGDLIRPAGLLNGVSPITGTAGGGVAAMTADLAAIIAPFITANAADRLVFLINPANVFKLQWASTAVGVYPFRDAAASGNIAGIPFIQSTSVPATTLILMRYADFMSATGDTPEWDVSDVATIHEEDGTYPVDQSMRPPTTTVAPIVDGAGVTAKPVRSLWQTASFGIRMLLDMDWAMRRTGMVRTVTGLTW